MATFNSEIKTYTYPHAIVYDFESYFDKTASTKPTPDLTFESNHIPISVSVGSTLTKDVARISNDDPTNLIKDFVSSIEGLAKVKSQFIPEDFEMLSKKQKALILEWVNQVPI